MEVGVPIVASWDAVDGMGISSNAILLADTNEELASLAIKILVDRDFSISISRLGRQEVENKFSHQATYQNFFSALSSWITE